MMLHTDAFNKSNKRKMAKADYIKNTKLPGVPPEVLDVREPRSLSINRLTSWIFRSAFTITSSSRPSSSSRIPWT